MADLDSWVWIGIVTNYSRNVPQFPTFTDTTTGIRLISLPPVASRPAWHKIPRPPYLHPCRVSAPHYSDDVILLTQAVQPPAECSLAQGFAPGFLAGLWHEWPYELAYSDLLPGVHGPGNPLDDGDIITVIREDNVLPPNVVEIWIHSDLSWFKRITVPDGQGNNFRIWTGAANLGGRRFDDGVGLWSDQVSGQSLTFTKAKTLALMSDTYTLQLDPSWLPPGSRVTFNWIDDSAQGTTS